MTGIVEIIGKEINEWEIGAVTCKILLKTLIFPIFTDFQALPTPGKRNCDVIVGDEWNRRDDCNGGQ